ncbi:MAG: hypothetical protein QOE58_2009, partial [Actinomycetota bacterium]|nr:hypothetical protein [Actinomycetota bacterium]
SCAAEVILADALPSIPRAITPVEWDGDYNEPIQSYDNNFLATLGSQLIKVHVQTTHNIVTGENGHSTGLAPLGSGGWQGVRRLVPAFPVRDGVPVMLYGVHDNGLLYRYTYAYNSTIQNWQVRSAGSQAGFGSVKGLVSVGGTASTDYLLCNTTTGTLTLIAVPRTTVLAAKISAVRTSTWQGFDSLIYTSAGVNQSPVNELVGVSPSGQWTRYTMDSPTRGAATRITHTDTLDGSAAGPKAVLSYPAGAFRAGS